MAETSIEWTDVTWNPVRGCARVSPGCEHCYAERVAHRFSGPGGKYEGLTVLGKKGPRWAGRARFHPEMLGAPLGWRRPRKVFVNSMSDLFHEDVTNEQIAAVFGVMAACPRHTFQILTKRPERMLGWFGWLQKRGGIGPYIRSIRVDGDRTLPRLFDPIARTEVVRGKSMRALSDPWMSVFNAAAGCGAGPLPNVWLGTSCEDQQRADQRLSALLECPAAVRFVSAEPLLGPIDFQNIASARNEMMLALAGVTWSVASPSRVVRRHPKIDWVIVGGESGPGARECDVQWIRSIVEQCRDASTAVFVKQFGAVWARGPMDERGRYPGASSDTKGGDMLAWPHDLRVRQFPEARP